MTITPNELRDVEIRTEMRGYSRDEVNRLLEEAAVTIEELTAKLAESERRRGGSFEAPDQ